VKLLVECIRSKKPRSSNTEPALLVTNTRNTLQCCGTMHSNTRLEMNSTYVRIFAVQKCVDIFYILIAFIGKRMATS
jgi:hypothetical protein